jgi:hypothetical protein
LGSLPEISEVPTVLMVLTAALVPPVLTASVGPVVLMIRVLASSPLPLLMVLVSPLAIYEALMVLTVPTAPMVATVLPVLPVLTVMGSLVVATTLALV